MWQYIQRLKRQDSTPEKEIWVLEFSHQESGSNRAWIKVVEGENLLNKTLFLDNFKNELLLRLNPPEVEAEEQE